MRPIFISLLTMLATAPSQIARADLPPGIPPDIATTGGMALLASAAFTCGDRDQQWMLDLLTDTKDAISGVLTETYPSGTPGNIAAATAVYMAQQVATGASIKTADCTSILTPDLLSAGDQAVAHERGQQ